MRISQSAEYLRTIWGPFSTKFKATAFEFDKKKPSQGATKMFFALKIFCSFHKTC